LLVYFSEIFPKQQLVVKVRIVKNKPMMRVLSVSKNGETPLKSQVIICFNQRNGKFSNKVCSPAFRRQNLNLSISYRLKAELQTLTQKRAFPS
jgi:hypothetical protein